MWKLTIEDDEQKATSLPLSHDEYAVGRDESNSIRLTDRNISRRHLVLKRNATGWVVRDLQSYNGTWVNGARVVAEQHVGHNDTIQLGDYRLEFSDETKIAPTAPVPQTPPPHQRPDRLVVVVGPSPGQEFPLDRQSFTLGRAEEMTISVNHSSVSRHHANLEALGNGRYEIVDQGSANGIRINGQEVRRGLLEAGDALELGDVRLRFVGRGKVFRGVLDRQMALPAIVGYDGVSSPKSPNAKQSGGMGKVVILGVGIGVIAVLVIALVMHFQKPKTTAPANSATSSANDDPGPGLLDQAIKASDAGNLDDAHGLLHKIPAASPARTDPRAKEIEAKWAKSMFAKFDACDKADDACRRPLVNEIASSGILDADLRQQALDRLHEIDPNAPDPLENPPDATTTTAAGGFTWSGNPHPVSTPTSSTPTPYKPSPTSTATTVVDDWAATTMAKLKPKLGTKTLSLGDLSQLYKACAQKQDSACVSECNRQIQAKKSH